jgi:hypothetical protein
MKRELIDRVRAGLDGWLQGDTMPLEKLLHPDVELLWWKTGEWDSHGKAEVLALIKPARPARASCLRRWLPSRTG